MLFNLEFQIKHYIENYVNKLCLLTFIRFRYTVCYINFVIIIVHVSSAFGPSFRDVHTCLVRFVYCIVYTYIVYGNKKMNKCLYKYLFTCCS